MKRKQKKKWEGQARDGIKTAYKKGKNFKVMKMCVLICKNSMNSALFIPSENNMIQIRSKNL